MLIENDATKFIARPAVIITGVRTGGTFLAHCLSNHPDIFCDRAESLHHASIWHLYLTTDHLALLKCLTHMQGYHVSICKLVYSQVFGFDVWTYLVEQQSPVLWLTRDNTIRQAVSVFINRMARSGMIDHPQHSFSDVKPIQVELQANDLLSEARELAAIDEQARSELVKMNSVLHLTYEQITQSAIGLGPEIGRQICDFLGVRYQAMTCDLKRVNAAPLGQIISNWHAVRPAIEASEFRACLESEE